MAQQSAPHWPADWDRERFLNSDATGELDQLSGDQVTAIRKGLLAEGGEPAFHEMLAEMGRRKAASSGPPPPPAAPPEPPFMQTMRLHEQRTRARWDPWGFVVYKSPEIADAVAWETCKQRFARLVDASLARYRGYPGLEEALARLQFQWIDHGDEADASAASVARAALRDQRLTTGAISLWPTTPSPGLHHSLCLYVTPASLRSILHASPPNSAVLLDQRKEIPFVMAISARAAAGPQEGQEDGDESNWRGFSNVTVEVLLTGLFLAVADDKLEPFEIGGHVRDEDIWFDHTRWGVYRCSN